MRNYKILYSIVIIIVIFGCKDIGKTTSGSLTTSQDFHKGTSSLKMEFLPNAPPQEVYEKSQFILGLNVKNEGASDIQKGLLALGVETDYIKLPEVSQEEEKSAKMRTDFARFKQLTENILEFDLAGKNTYTPFGEQDNIFLTPETKSLAEQSQTLKSTITATACFPYRTEAVTTVCIDSDITNSKLGEKSCIVKSISMDSQGAPVAVTKIDYQMLPRGPNYIKPEFIITVENRGNGEVIYPEYNLIKSLCGIGQLSEAAQEGQSIFNVVKLRAALSRGYDTPLKCEPDAGDNSAIIRFKDKKGITRCTLEEGVDVKEGTFTTPLQIIIDYGYTFTISQEITIKKPEQ